jgi:hypothetical protein
MNIELPSKFFYSANDRNIAYVKDGILYIEGYVNYEDLMYSLTYTLKGYDRCYYCGREISSRKRTLDHMYPRSWGGISIPNNLIPACSSCNSRKGSLTRGQFNRWRKNQANKQNEKSHQSYTLRNEERFKKELILPEEWLTDYPISTVVDQIDFSPITEKSNRRINEFYRKYKHYPKPIIVSSNDWVFVGMHVLFHAKTHGVPFVKAVVLDNVVRIRS